MKQGSALKLLAASTLALAASPSAFATWTFSASSECAYNCSSGSKVYYANTTVTANPSTDPSLTISGVYAGSSLNNGFDAGATWVLDNTALPNSRPVYYGGGLGMASDGTTDPNHAIDNNGKTEAILLSFSGSSVILSSIGLGYVSGDSDISLFRYTGATAPTLNGTGASLASMTAAGWELVGNYANLAVDTSNPYNMVNGCTQSSGVVTCAQDSKSSSWWLISAYNKSYGGGWTQGNDYFKLYAVAGTVVPKDVPGVPEPASLALACTALVGVAGSMRRRQRKS